MKLSCVHCGNEFSIRAEQLGTRGRCPHCRAMITLPKADDTDAMPNEEEEKRPFAWMENSISGLGSFVLHVLVLLILALVYRGGDGEFEGETYEVFIGDLDNVELSENQDEEIEEKNEVTQVSDESFDEPVEDIVPPGVTDTDVSDTVDDISFSASGGASQSVQLESMSAASASSGGEDFQGLIRRLKRDGLDIVITFDSTGSMSGEINEVKRRIEKIGNTLLKIVPKTRISICTYRDDEDIYEVKGLQLTNNITQISAYLDDIRAGGGGDTPEAVHRGLQWPITNNAFRKKARKVILLFGDAPPHSKYEKTCLRLASEFRSQQGGIVSTVTCRNTDRIDQFVEIAQAGGGEAFLTREEKEIMEQLIILVFGSKHKKKVLDAFKIYED